MEIGGLSFIFNWLENNNNLLIYLGVFSFFLFFVSIFGIKYFAAKIPYDYFLRKEKFSRLRERSIFLWLVYKLLKNLIGYILIFFGVLALILPGQGVIMILIGLVMSDYPGKLNLEKKIISINSVRKGINWLRMKSGVRDIEL